MLWWYLGAALVLIAYEGLRRREALVDWLTFVNLLAAVYYVAVPIIHLYASAPLQWRALAAFPEASQSGLTFLALIMAHVSVIGGYELGRRLRVARQIEIVAPRVSDRSVFIYGVLVILTFGAVSIALAISWGGIVESLAVASEVRAGRASRGLADYAQYVFSTAPFVFLLVLSSRPSSRISATLSWPVTLVVLSVVLYLALLTAGRANLLLPFLLAYLLWLNRVKGWKRALAPGVTALLGVSIFFVAAYGKAALWELDSFTEGFATWQEQVLARQTRLHGDPSLPTALGALLGYFDHHFVSLYVAIEKPWLYEIPRILLDWPRAVVSYLPFLEQPDFVVTSTPSGHGRDLFREAGLPYVGYVPPGWVAMNYINLSWLGVVIMPLLAGCIGGFVHRVLCANMHRHGWMPGLYVALGWLWLITGIGADPFMAFPVLAVLGLILLPILVGMRARVVPA